MQHVLSLFKIMYEYVLYRKVLGVFALTIVDTCSKGINVFDSAFWVPCVGSRNHKAFRPTAGLFGWLCSNFCDDEARDHDETLCILPEATTSKILRHPRTRIFKMSKLPFLHIVVVVIVGVNEHMMHKDRGIQAVQAAASILRTSLGD